MKKFSFAGKTDSLIFIEDGFTFPSMSKIVQYRNTSHASYRKRTRSILEPLTISIPIMAFRRNVTRQELNERLNQLLYSESPRVLSIEDVDWYVIGEFNGPYEIPNTINGLTSFEIDFTSTYPYKFYDVEKTQTANKTVIINSKTQLPTIPLIELSNLTGNDVQISISGDSFRRIRLSGDLPSLLTIDIENEKIYETNSGLNMMKLLRYDSAFEDFKIKNNDVVVVTNASDTTQAKLIYKELLL